jgi:hypothetical protein
MNLDGSDKGEVRSSNLRAPSRLASRGNALHTSTPANPAGLNEDFGDPRLLDSRKCRGQFRKSLRQIPWLANIARPQPRDDSVGGLDDHPDRAPVQASGLRRLY